MNDIRVVADIKNISFQINYRAGNFIGFVVQRKVAAWTKLVERIETEPLSKDILSYGKVLLKKRLVVDEKIINT